MNWKIDFLFLHLAAGYFFDVQICQVLHAYYFGIVNCVIKCVELNQVKKIFLAAGFLVIAGLSSVVYSQDLYLSYVFKNNVTYTPNLYSVLQVLSNSDTCMQWIQEPIRNFQSIDTLSSSTEEQESNFRLLQLPPLKDSIPYCSLIDYERKVIRTKDAVWANVSGDEFIFTEEPLTENEWQILDSTKMLDSIQLSLARIDFKCRTYYAWFAPSIPIFCSPWKFPKCYGLIFSVKSSDHKISFSLKDYKYVNSTIEEYLPFPTQLYNEHLPDWKKTNSKRFNKISAKLKRKMDCIDCTFKSKLEIKLLECFEY